MSAAASEGAGGGSGSGDRPGGDRRQSFTKFMNRAKSALRRDKTKRQSSSGDVAADVPDMPETPSASETPVTSPPLAPPAPVSGLAPTLAAASEKTPAPETKAKPEAPEAAEAVEKKVAANVTSRAALQHERARALFEKYGYTLEPNEWPMPSSMEPVERVHKPIRMRVHRQCHRCQTTFGVDKICSQCSHKRCKKCPRYPVKKPKHGQETAAGKVAGITVAGAATTAAAAAAAITTTTGPGPETLYGKSTAKYRFVIPAKTEKQDRVRKDIKMAVHRTCHKCAKQFMRHEKICSGCHHVRCTKCPRYPPKLDKYPNGYPGDAQPDDEPPPPAVKQRTFKKVRMIVRYYCHECENLYPRGEKTCPSCQHRRCDQCRRVPAKKVRIPPDPDVVKSVEAKLAALHLRSSSWMATGGGGGDHPTDTTTAGSETAGA